MVVVSDGHVLGLYKSAYEEGLCWSGAHSEIQRIDAVPSGTVVHGHDMAGS